MAVRNHDEYPQEYLALLVQDGSPVEPHLAEETDNNEYWQNERAFCCHVDVVEIEGQ